MEKIMTKEELLETIKNNLKILYRRTLDDANKQQIYQALAYAMEDIIVGQWMETHKKTANQKVCYYNSRVFKLKFKKA